MIIPSVLKKAVSAIWGDTPRNVRYCESSGEVTSSDFVDESARQAARRAIYMTQHHI